MCGPPAPTRAILPVERRGIASPGDDHALPPGPRAVRHRPVRHRAARRRQHRRLGRLRGRRRRDDRAGDGRARRCVVGAGLRRRARARHEHRPGADRARPDRQPVARGRPAGRRARVPGGPRRRAARDRLGRLGLAGAAPPDVGRARPRVVRRGGLPGPDRRALGGRQQRPAGRLSRGPCPARLPAGRPGADRRAPRRPGSGLRRAQRGATPGGATGDVGPGRVARHRLRARVRRPEHLQRAGPTRPAGDRAWRRAGRLLGRAGRRRAGSGARGGRCGRGPVRRRRARQPHRLPQCAVRRRADQRPSLPRRQADRPARRGVHPGRSPGRFPRHRRRRPASGRRRLRSPPARSAICGRPGTGSSTPS